MSFKLNEKDFQKMMKNTHLKVNSSFGDKSLNINIPEQQKQTKKSLPINTDNNDKPKKTSNTTVDFNKVCDSILNARVEYSYDEKSFLLIFHGARILSTNQIHTFLQKKSKNSVPFYIVKYKSVWEKKMERTMQQIILDHIQKNDNLPKFHLSSLSNNQKVKVFLYRQSTKLLDEDNMYGAFKFIIDCLRKKYEVPEINMSYNLLEDDNKKFISKIEPFQVKNKENVIAIKLCLDDNYRELENLDEFKLLV